MSAAKQWNNINEPVEFGLRVSLDDCLKLSEQRLNDIATDKKRDISHCEFALNREMPINP